MQQNMLYEEKHNLYFFTFIHISIIIFKRTNYDFYIFHLNEVNNISLHLCSFVLINSVLYYYVHRMDIRYTIWI